MPTQHQLDDPLPGHDAMGGKWFIAFMDYKKDAFWNHWGTTRGFRHVALARPISDKLVLMNWRYATTDLMIVSRRTFFQWVAEHDGRVLEYERTPPCRSFPIIHLLTCVTAACHTLHLPMSLTPRGLYRSLVRRGALTVMESCAHGDGTKTAETFQTGAAAR
jgi:hypothetical protein